MPWSFILPEALYRFWQATRPGREVGAAGRLLLIWVLVILGFFTLSSSRIEYYSLPALPALALIMGWRIQRYLDTPGDRVILWTSLALGLLGLSLLVLLPYLERVCVANRREFSGMVSLVSPLARQATWLFPAVALAGVLAAWRKPSPPGRGRLRRPGRGNCLVHLPGPDDPYSPDGRQNRGGIRPAGGLPPGPGDHGAHRRV